MSTKAQQDFQFSLSDTLNGFIELIITSRLRWLIKCYPQAKAYKSTPNVSEQEELNLHQSGLPFRQISTLLLLHPHIFILLLSVLLLCWEISPFSWVIHRWGLPQSAWAAQLIELSCTEHTLSLSTHASAVCTCTLCAWYMRTHQSTVAEKPGFSSSPYLIRHHICRWKTPRQWFPSSSSSSVPSPCCNNSTYSIFTLLCGFHDNSGREHQPMAVAVVWVVVLLGSVELAASVCMLWVYACMWGEL